jgi:hypothetical protein
MVSYLPSGGARLGRPPAFTRSQRYRAQEALRLVRAADPLNTETYLQLYASVMSKATKAPDARTSEIMFRRLAIALEIVADSVGWPNHIAGM